MEICHFCGNKNFKQNKVQYTYKRDKKYIIVDDVPCEQCEYCGEQYFNAIVLQDIEDEFNAIHSKGKTVKNKIIVPIETYNKISHLKKAERQII
jgi:YgiT-type zinc finger domain-containing protein